MFTFTCKTQRYSLCDRHLSFISLSYSNNQSRLQSSTTLPEQMWGDANTDFRYTEIWLDWIIHDAHRRSKISSSFALFTEKQVWYLAGHCYYLYAFGWMSWVWMGGGEAIHTCDQSAHDPPMCVCVCMCMRVCVHAGMHACVCARTRLQVTRRVWGCCVSFSVCVSFTLLCMTKYVQ